MNSAFLPVGYVTPSGQDVLPTTGPHLDVRVMKDGKYIDPSTIRSLLTRLKIGDKKTPLWKQEGTAWNPSFPITSGYGSRSAPTKGASTFHPAHDYGVPEKTLLAWEGPGTFTPGKGYGQIRTKGSKGEDYLIKLLHTTGGKAGGTLEQPVQQPAPQQTVLPPGSVTYNVFLGDQRDAQTDPVRFLREFGHRNNLFNPRAIYEAFAPQPQTDAVSQIEQLLSASPRYI